MTKPFTIKEIYVPVWTTCNPWKLPLEYGWYFTDGNDKKHGPFQTYEYALLRLEKAGGRQKGKKEYMK